MRKQQVEVWIDRRPTPRGMEYTLCRWNKALGPRGRSVVIDSNTKRKPLEDLADELGHTLVGGAA